MKLLISTFLTIFTLQVSAQVQVPVPSGNIPPPPEETGIKTEDYVYTITEEMPEFPGGMSAMQDFSKNNLLYPPYARENGIQGKCFIKFMVDKEGTLKNFQLLKGVPGCKECDDEALRMLKTMPKWRPGKMKSKPVNCWYTHVVTFKPEVR